MREKLVEAKGLYKRYALKSDKLFAKRRYLKAVDGVTFDIYKGEFFGVVGESGCGKSTTAKLILDMEHPTKGTVFFKGRDMSKLKPKEWRALRLDMQMIFQDPLGALDPYMCVAAVEEIVIAVPALPATMEPGDISNQTVAMYKVFMNMYDTLIKIDYKNNTGTEPGLAESWKRIDDTTLELYLRKGAKFHDGSEFTADDVVALFGPRSSKCIRRWIRRKGCQRL